MSVDIDIYECYGIDVKRLHRDAEETDKITFLYQLPDPEAQPVLVAAKSLEHLGGAFDEVNHVLLDKPTDPQWDTDIEEFCKKWKMKYKKPAWRIVVCVG